MEEVKLIEEMKKTPNTYKGFAKGIFLGSLALIIAMIKLEGSYENGKRSKKRGNK